jgi:uncharacterized protein YggE
MQRFLSAVGLALGFMTAAASAQIPPAPEMPGIVTQGEATLKRPPDRAWVSVTVESRQARAADARREAATQMTTVQTAIRAAGIPADAIKTTNYSLQPQMEWDGGRSRINGYVVHNQIEVRVDNIDQVSEVIDAAASVKTSLVLTVGISSVRFDLKNPEKFEQEALTLAVKDAMARAQAIAAGLSRTLGPVIRVEDQRVAEQPRPMPFMGARAVASAAQAPSTPIEPNEIEVRASVSLTVRIQ